MKIHQAAAAYMAGDHIVAYDLTNGGGRAVLKTQKAGNPQGQPSYGFVYEGRKGSENGRLRFEAKSAEESIRLAATTQRTTNMDRTVYVLKTALLGEVERDSVPVVPLGPNRTRNGQEVVVLEITPASLRIVMRLPSGAWELDNRNLDGTNFRGVNDYDLVGHLPPEPPMKSGPREVWALCTEDGLPFAWSHEKTGPQFKLFREVIEG